MRTPKSEEGGRKSHRFNGTLRHSRTAADWLPALPRPWPQMADTQQFFTGKLYVGVHMLKLPAEELLWSALPRMIQQEEEDVWLWEWEYDSVVSLAFVSCFYCFYFFNAPI